MDEKKGEELRRRQVILWSFLILMLVPLCGLIVWDIFTYNPKIRVYLGGNNPTEPLSQDWVKDIFYDLQSKTVTLGDSHLDTTQVAFCLVPDENLSLYGVSTAFNELPISFGVKTYNRLAVIKQNQRLCFSGWYQPLGFDIMGEGGP